MSQALDMSLDDIIRNNKKSGGSNGNFRGRGRGRGFVSGPGPARRFPNRAPTRTTPYLIPQMVQVQQMLAMGGSGSESATKLYVSNLDYGVSNEDLKVLFSEVGEVKRHSIHYDRSGRSKGTAEVVFTRQSDALTAVERYNNVQLDGKPMKIELVGVNIVTPPAPPTTNGILGNPSGNFRSIMCLPISVKDSSKRGEISGLFRTMTGKKGLQVGDGTVEVVAAAAEDLGGAVGEAEAMVRRCLLKLLMRIWRSII